MSTTDQAQPQAKELKFPPGFVWGVATAAYQIEGAIDEDGRSESIWDRFCATPGKIKDSSSGAIADDHYHRYPQDIKLMQELGVGAYRFSVAWPRIIPNGTGAVNQKGLDFYDRLVDNLLEAGITPYATLYHWDLPQVLQDKGGWANRDTAYAFADYAEVVVKHLGDRVKGWITHNEPFCASLLSYRIGEHAPGLKDHHLALRAVHHILLSHGLAVPRIRQHTDAPVGITLNLWPIHPANPANEADIAAAQRSDAENNRLFLDPIFKGSYPPDYLERQAPGALPVEPGDLEIISTPIDFLGVNYYNRQVAEADPQNPDGWHNIKPAGVYTSMGWEIYPAGIYELMVRLNQEYTKLPIYITENGSSGEEPPDQQGVVNDELRLNYIRDHLHQLQRATQEGCTVAGYFAWSLIDNFEWSWGYSRRFGIVYVDFDTQERIIKNSGHWFSQVARSNTLPSH